MHPRRQLPDRTKMTQEKVGSIRDTAKNKSRSTGKQSTDVRNPRSRYSRQYLSAGSAIDNMDIDSQLESVNLSEQQEQTKSGGRVSEVVPIPMEYGNDYDLNGYAALYSGRIKNDRPDGQGKLLFKGVDVYGCGDEKYDVTIDGTFHEGLLTRGKSWAHACDQVSCTRATTNAWK